MDHSPKRSSGRPISPGMGVLKDVAPAGATPRGNVPGTPEGVPGGEILAEIKF